MVNNKKVIAIIPARGGSKRLPRKNVLPLLGKPLIAWSIQAALQAKSIDRVMVSTDDEEIAEISKHYGAEVPELRPSHLATDTTSTTDVIEHILDVHCADETHFIILQPTSPLRTAQDIDNAFLVLQEKQAQGVISVCPCEHPPQWSNLLTDNHCLDGFIRQTSNQRSQDLGQYHRLNGAIYIYSIDAFRKNRGIQYDHRTFAYVMDVERSIDIDTKIDFMMAEVLAKINE